MRALRSVYQYRKHPSQQSCIRVEPDRVAAHLIDTPKHGRLQPTSATPDIRRSAERSFLQILPLSLDSSLLSSLITVASIPLNIHLILVEYLHSRQANNEHSLS